MCRLLAYVSPVPRTAADVLGSDQLERFAKLAELHSHGWGAEWVATAGAPVETLRDFAAPHDGTTWDEVTRRRPAVAMGLHLRLASGGAAVVPSNNHPFSMDGISLVHNGTITPVERLEARLAPATLAAMTSTTDSERYLGLVADRRRTSEDLAGAVASAVAELRAAFPAASMNAVVIDDTSLVVVHASTFAPEPADEIRAELGVVDLPDGHETCYYRMYWRTEPDGTVVIASSGLDTLGWTTLPLDSITSFDLATGAISQRRITHHGAA